MPTFLELCELAVQHSNVVPRAPTTVVGQTGRMGKLVASVIYGWKAVQLAKANWLFLRGEWWGTMTIGQATYTPFQIAFENALNVDNAPRFGEWLGDYAGNRVVSIYDPAVGRQEENYLRQISWERWKRSYDIGVHDPNRPTEYCLAPDGTIRFGSKPDKAYVARGEYRKSPQVLGAGTSGQDDERPDLQERYHMVIVWRAIMRMAEIDMRPGGLQAAKGNYAEMIGEMNRDLLPSFTVRSERPLA